MQITSQDSSQQQLLSVLQHFHADMSIEQRFLELHLLEVHLFHFPFELSSKPQPYHLQCLGHGLATRQIKCYIVVLSWTTKKYTCTKYTDTHRRCHKCLHQYGSAFRTQSQIYNDQAVERHDKQCDCDNVDILRAPKETEFSDDIPSPFQEFPWTSQWERSICLCAEQAAKGLHQHSLHRTVRGLPRTALQEDREEWVETKGSNSHNRKKL